MKEYVDEKVGKLVYDDAWYSKNVFTFAGKTVYTVFQAFEDELLTKEQQDNYLYFIENIKELLGKAIKAIREDLQDDELLKKLYFTETYFNRFNEFGFLASFEGCDELDIAIKFNSNGEITEIGEQDILI